MPTHMTPVRTIQPQPEFAGILRDAGPFAEGKSDDSAERLNRWFDTLLIQSGLRVPPAVFLMSLLLAGFTVGGAAFVIQESLLTAAMAAAIGFMLPIIWVLLVRNRRQVRLMRQIPSMIDELARAARTGRSLEQCFELVAADTPVPLGHELEQCVRKMQLGLSLSTSLEDLPHRTGLTVTNLLVMALSVHHEFGGDVVMVLDRLARTIRDRLQFLGRLRAATAASRATAVLMLILPPAILAFFMIREPEYISSLTSSTWGARATGAALLLEVIGTVWVVRVLKQSERG
jgi:tight adherence protein B